MKKCILIFALLFALLPVYAQDSSPDNPEAPAEIDWFEYEVYSRGDRPLYISLGLVFPTVFIGAPAYMGLSVGGAGILSYDYFLTPNVFLGGEIGGMFSFSRSGHSLFIIPFGARIGYQFVFRRIEIPLTLMVGLAPQLYLNQNYFGPIVKAGGSVFYRYNSSWSFGINTSWWLIPQWSTGPNPAVYGNFLELTISARHHF